MTWLNGGGLDRYGVAETFELGDGATALTLGMFPIGIEVGAEVATVCTPRRSYGRRARTIAACIPSRLGDPVRLRLLSLIAARGGGEVCVCELTGAFALTGPTISHHLRVLREAGLVGCERRGTWVYYRVVPAALAALSRRLDPGVSAAWDTGRRKPPRTARTLIAGASFAAR